MTGTVWIDENCDHRKDSAEALATRGDVLVYPGKGSLFGLRISPNGTFRGAVRIGDTYVLTTEAFTKEFPARTGEFSPHFIGATFLDLSHEPQNGRPVEVDIPLCLVEGPRGADFTVAQGHFFTQTSTTRTSGLVGYAVTNEGDIPFWDEFQRLGGVPALGYPVSQRFTYKGFVTQAFQKGVLQWQGQGSRGQGQVFLLNVFDELHQAGKDDWLLATRATPRQLDPSFDAGKSWDDIVRDRLALLEANPAIQERYFSAPDPLLFYGLPTSRVEDLGNHYALRLQRAVIQQWKVEVPWALAGEVTVANGGDIAKEAGLFPAEALVPEGPP